jgi:hypothetical protein
VHQCQRFDAFVHEFNTERLHEALGMKCPAQLYTASPRRYDGLPELTYSFHDRDILVTACGRLCLHRKRINISSVLAGQKLGIKEVDGGALSLFCAGFEILGHLVLGSVLGPVESNHRIGLQRLKPFSLDDCGGLLRGQELD